MRSVLNELPSSFSESPVLQLDMKRTLASCAPALAVLVLSLGLNACANSGVAAGPVAADASKPVPAAEAKERLVRGNARFVAGRSDHPRQTPDRRTELANVQHPFAVVLGCADSRVGPEVVFDQGIGDLFVVREAGNVIDDHSIGSIEYAVEHLHANLIVVLGHERCGAIAAARGGHAEGHVESLIRSIRPAVEQTRHQDATATCQANVRNVVRALEKSKPVLYKKVQSGEISVVGAYYSLDTGAVTYLAAK